MPTLVQVRNAVDNFLAARWPALVSRQDAFFATHSRYWQGLRTHSLTPAHTTAADGSALCDMIDRRPSDESGTWRDAFPGWASELFPMVFSIDAYDGPQGPGWVATVSVLHNGSLYQRSRNVGPEEHRTKGWRRVETLGAFT